MNKRLFKHITFRGDVGAAESYRNGDWECDDLPGLIRIMISNLSTADQLGKGFASFRRTFVGMLQRFRPNNRQRSKRGIHAHYDLGNAFFSEFLDSTMNYSSGIFEFPNESMFSASNNKMRMVCEKLNLEPNHHLLEIGTGWGGLAIYAAKNYGCRVTTTTISEAQYSMAVRRVEKAGLETPN